MITQQTPAWLIHKGAVAAPLAAIVLLLAACSPPDARNEHSVRAMNTSVRITFRADTPPETRSSAVSAMRRLMDEVFDRLDSEGERTEISLINRSGSTLRLPVSRDSYNLFLLIEEYASRSGGAFDITTSPAAHLWGFHGSATPAEPLPNSLVAAARAGIGHDKVRAHANSIELLSPLTRINVDDIARAYALDLSVIRLRRMNIQHIRIDTPGVVRTAGRPEKDQAWLYAIPNPYELEGPGLGQIKLDPFAAAAAIRLCDEHVVIQGVPYSHIIDPRTGRPADSTAGSYAFAPTATEAYALANALFVLGPAGIAAMREAFPRCEFALVPREESKRLIITSGLIEAFTPAAALDYAIEFVE